MKNAHCPNSSRAASKVCREEVAPTLHRTSLRFLRDVAAAPTPEGPPNDPQRTPKVKAHRAKVEAPKNMKPGNQLVISQQIVQPCSDSSCVKGTAGPGEEPVCHTSRFREDPDERRK